MPSLRQFPIRSRSRVFPSDFQMGVVIETSIWELSSSAYIFIFLSCFLSLSLFPFYLSKHAPTKSPSFSDHSTSSSATSSLRFQRYFLLLYSLASGTLSRKKNSNFECLISFFFFFSKLIAEKRKKRNLIVDLVSTSSFSQFWKDCGRSTESLSWLTME